MKKLFSLILTLLLFTGCLPLTAMAEDTGKQAEDALQEGLACWYGIHGKTYDRDAAVELFQQAADAGSADAWYYLGNAVLAGSEDGKYAEALLDFQTAGDKGSLLGLCGQAILLQNGRGVEKNVAAAKSLYEKAIAGGCIEANEGLASLVLSGYDLGPDSEDALSYATKALDGDDFQLVSRAMLDIASVYENGIGVEQNHKKALEWNKKAANAGFNAAYGIVGAAYSAGTGVDPDAEEALSWCAKGAEKGDFLPLAQCYLYGIGTDPDYKKAMDLFTAHLNTSVVKADAGPNDAISYIGYMYQNGLGVDQDYAAALEWYDKGIAAGDPWCTASAAYMYENGLGTEPDPARAAELYEQGAVEDSAVSLARLADMYLNGEAVPQDYEKAIEYFEKGAELRDTYCCMSLGYLYETGEGVEMNEDKAITYYRMALDNAVEGEEEIAEYCREALLRLGYTE